jgi:hypothetical protein
VNDRRPERLGLPDHVGGRRVDIGLQIQVTRARVGTEVVGDSVDVCMSEVCLADGVGPVGRIAEAGEHIERPSQLAKVPGQPLGPDRVADSLDRQRMRNHVHDAIARRDWRGPCRRQRDAVGQRSGLGGGVAAQRLGRLVRGIEELRRSDQAADLVQLPGQLSPRYRLAQDDVEMAIGEALRRRHGRDADGGPDQPNLHVGLSGRKLPHRLRDRVQDVAFVEPLEAAAEEGVQLGLIGVGARQLHQALGQHHRPRGVGLHPRHEPGPQLRVEDAVPAGGRGGEASIQRGAEARSRPTPGLLWRCSLDAGIIGDQSRTCKR